MHFPLYRQPGLTDCGPTCLRMVATYYGRRVSAAFLRASAQLGEDGISLLGLAAMARALSFEALGVKLSFQLLAEAPLPCIVHWQQNHFVVVYAITNASAARAPVAPASLLEDELVLSAGANQLIAEESKHAKKEAGGGVWAGLATSIVHVADPMGGRLTYSGTEFCRQWSTAPSNEMQEGTVLLLEPISTFCQ